MASPDNLFEKNIGLISNEKLSIPRLDIFEKIVPSLID